MSAIAAEIQQRGIEQHRILQEGEMADIGQDQQAGARYGRSDIFGVLAPDPFVMIAIHDQDGRLDGAELRIRPVRLVAAHILPICSWKVSY